MSEKRKSTSPSAMQVKKWWKTIGIKEKLDITRLKKVNELFTYSIMSDWLLVAHVQFVTALIELKTFLSQQQTWLFV